MANETGIEPGMWGFEIQTSKHCCEVFKSSDNMIYYVESVTLCNPYLIQGGPAK